MHKCSAFLGVVQALGHAHLKKGDLFFCHRKESDIVHWVLAPPLVSLTKNMHLGLNF